MTHTIKSLRFEAAISCDEAQVAICDKALAGDKAALGECMLTIAEAGAEFELVDSDTDETLRAATPIEVGESYASGPCGHIDVDGCTCYVVPA